MSSLLKEAIVDAKALREAAMKNAEASIIEKYSDEVRQTLQQLIEQDELGGELDAGTTADPLADDPLASPEIDPLADEAEQEEVAEDIPLAAIDNLSNKDGTGFNNLPAEGENVEVNINLDAIQEAIQALESEITEQEELELELNENDILNILSENIPLQIS